MKVWCKGEKKVGERDCWGKTGGLGLEVFGRCDEEIFGCRKFTEFFSTLGGSKLVIFFFFLRQDTFGARFFFFFMSTKYMGKIMYLQLKTYLSPRSFIKG